MFRRCRWDYEYEPQGFWLTGWRYDYGYEPWTGEWDYRYEPESYWVPKTSYLPDFLLSGLPIWLEVKGVDADPRTLDMCRSFSLEIGQDVCLFCRMSGMGSTWSPFPTRRHDIDLSMGNADAAGPDPIRD
jgi:hypothetical protein